MDWVTTFTPRHLRSQEQKSSASAEEEAGLSLEPGWAFSWRGKYLVPSENRTSIRRASSSQHSYSTVYDIPGYVRCTFNDTHSYPYRMVSAHNIHIFADKFFYYSGSCRHIAMALWIKCLPDNNSSSICFQTAEFSHFDTVERSRQKWRTVQEIVLRLCRILHHF